MARGWESKDVESQMEAASERRKDDLPEMTAAQLKFTLQRNDLLLSRTRILSDLASARSPGYRAILERSLQFLDDKLTELDVNRPDRHE